MRVFALLSRPAANPRPKIRASLLETIEGMGHHNAGQKTDRGKAKDENESYDEDGKSMRAAGAHGNEDWLAEACGMAEETAVSDVMWTKSKRCAPCSMNAGTEHA